MLKMADKEQLNGYVSNGHFAVNPSVTANVNNGKTSVINGNCNHSGENNYNSKKNNNFIKNVSIGNGTTKVKHDCKLPLSEKLNSISYKEPPDGGLRAWVVMFSAFLCNGVIFGVINTYSVIHSHLQDKLTEQHDTEASSKAALVGSLTIGTTFLMSPIAGMLTDKIGLRTTTLIGGALCAGGLLLSSFFTHSIEALYITYGIMFGLGASLAYTPTLAILGHYFKRYHGKVSGFVTAGSSVFTAIMPPGLDYLIKRYGLSLTLQAMAAISCIIILSAIVYKPLHPPLAPPKKKPGRSQLNIFIRSLVNVDIWKRKRYVIWALCVPLALFGYFVPYVHMVKFVQTSFSGQSENLPVMCIGISSGLGRLMFGILADLPKINRILLQQASLACIGFLTMLLPATNSYSLLIVFTLMMGLFDGCFISLLGPIAYEICGPQGATQAIGFLLGLSSLPLTVGPPIAGKIFDKTGSYTLPLLLAGIPPIIGATVMFLIRCVRDDSHSSINKSALDKDGTIVPLTNTKWDEELKTERFISNGNTVHTIQDEREPSLAKTESLNDVYTVLEN